VFAVVVAFMLVGCDLQDESELKQTATAAAPTERATPSPTTTFTPIPTATATPECDEKCEWLRTYTPIPTATLGPPAAAYPVGTRTGEPAVDSILDAIERRDQSALTKLIGLTTLPCVAMGNRQPEPLLCRDGVAPGTPKSGIWIAHVEGGLAEMTDDAAAGRVLAAANEHDWKLVSVYSYERAGTVAEWLPETDFFITFTTWHPQGGPSFDNLRIADGRITGLHFAFPEPYPAWEQPSDPGWLLPRAR
jgi:hypothetical protein